MRGRPSGIRWVTRCVVYMISIWASGVVLARGGHWTIADIVQVRQVRSVAVSAAGREAAYIVRVPSIATDSVNYELYQVSLVGSPHPKRLLRAGYMLDVTRAPRRGRWSVLADLGRGVQLYSVGEKGAVAPIAVSSSTLIVGGFRGAIGPMGKPHRTGVYSYEWSPDGAELWYATFRVRTREQRAEYAENGVEYDDRTLNGLFFQNYPGKLVGLELHVERSNGANDRVVAFLPAVEAMDSTYLRRDLGRALWMPDSRHIEYAMDVIGKSGDLVPLSWSVNALTGVRTALPKESPRWTMAVPSADGRGYYEVDAGNHLIKYSFTGRELADLGRQQFSLVGMSQDYPGGGWMDRKTEKQIVSALYGDHTGLVALPPSAAAQTLERIKDNMGPCDFSQNLEIGACVRQSQTLPPEVVAVDTLSGKLRTVGDPNGASRRIAPLRVIYDHWVNRYGETNDGYVVYPRDFSRKRTYPVVLITHANGAVNTFADQGFQAEIPVQVLAESGYFVVEANTPSENAADRKSWMKSAARSSMGAVTRRDRAFIQEPVSSMEAAVASLVRMGVANPAKVGIAGYSAGADLSLFAMTQSKVFRVGAIDDGASAVDADLYWRCGTRDCTALHRALYGGSPFSSNASVLETYRRFCPDFRVSSFAGPLLEQPSGGVADTFSRLVLLREAGIPHDVIYYPNESHIFWNPRAAAASMHHTLEWFDYWLMGKSSSDPSKAPEYRRWDAMREAYGARCPSCLAGLGSWSVPAQTNAGRKPAAHD